MAELFQDISLRPFAFSCHLLALDYDLSTEEAPREPNTEAVLVHTVGDGDVAVDKRSTRVAYHDISNSDGYSSRSVQAVAPASLSSQLFVKRRPLVYCWPFIERVVLHGGSSSRWVVDQ